MKLIYSFAILIVALISPQVVRQVTTLYRMGKNEVPYLVPRQAPYKFEHVLLDQVRNCEDHLLEPSGWAILSCDFSRDGWNTVLGIYSHHDTTEGGIFLYDYAGRHRPSQPLIQVELLNFPLAGKDFHPLGLDYHSPSNTLFVANTARAGPRIEAFQLSLQDATATHTSTIVSPHVPSPNSIHALSPTSLYVTNDHFFPHRRSALLSHMETYLAPPLSTVVHLDLTHSLSSPTVSTVARQAFPNGLARLNATHYAVASSNTARVHIYATGASAEDKWTYAAEIPLGFLPDNLSLDGQGRLLIAGHAHPASLNRYAGSRLRCRDPASKAVEDECKRFYSPSFAVEWTEAAGVRELYVGAEYATGAAVSRDVKSGMGLISGPYGNGLLQWRE